MLDALNRAKCPVCGRWKMTYRSKGLGPLKMFRHFSYQPSQNDPGGVLGAKQWLPCPGSNRPIPEEVS